MITTILLVEDDESLRRLAQRLLAKLGHNVVAAGDGNAAVAGCRDCPDEIQLLITDVFMPDIGGPELSKQLLSMRPEMKVLFVSGSNEILEHEGLLPEGAHFLQKPYTQDQFRSKINEILNAA